MSDSNNNEECKTASTSLKLYEFDESALYSKSCAVFTKDDVETILTKIGSAVQDFQTTKPVFDEKKKAKMSFEMCKELTDEDKDSGLPAARCKVQCKLLRVDEERICVEFTRLQGNQMYFFE